MARLDLTVQEPIHGYPALPLAVNAADVAFTAAGASFADGAAFPMTGRELLLVKNDNVGAQTITIESTLDPRTKRTGNITAFSIGAGEIAAFYFDQVAGWAQSTGKLHFAVTAADVNLAVVRTPR